MDLRILDNPEKKRFEAPIEGKIAFIEYIRAKDAIYLTHTEVPESLGGRGIGSALVKEVLQQMDLNLGISVPDWPPENIEEIAKKFEDPFNK